MVLAQHKNDVLRSPTVAQGTSQVYKNLMLHWASRDGEAVALEKKKVFWEWVGWRHHKFRRRKLKEQVTLLRKESVLRRHVMNWVEYCCESVSDASTRSAQRPRPSHTMSSESPSPQTPSSAQDADMEGRMEAALAYILGRRTHEREGDRGMENVCSHAACRKPLERPLQCAQCKASKYCSKDCQKMAWRAGHKHECVPTRAKGAKSKDALVRSVLHAMGLRRNEFETEEGKIITADQRRVVLQVIDNIKSNNYKGLALMAGDVLPTCRELQEIKPNWSAMLYHSLANSLLALGFRAEAPEIAQIYASALDMYEEVGDLAGQGAVYSGLGICYKAYGQYAEAIDMFSSSLAFSFQVADPYRALLGKTYNQLVDCYQALGEYSKALDACREAHLIFQAAGDCAGQGKTYALQGDAYASLEQYAEAIERYEQSLASFKEAGNLAGQGNALHSMGNCYVSLGEQAEEASSKKQHQDKANDLLEQARLVYPMLLQEKEDKKNGIAFPSNKNKGPNDPPRRVYALVEDMSEVDWSLCSGKRDSSKRAAAYRAGIAGTAGAAAPGGVAGAPAAVGPVCAAATSSAASCTSNAAAATSNAAASTSQRAVPSVLAAAVDDEAVLPDILSYLL